MTPRMKTAAWLSAVTGFISLSYEILWVRVYSYLTAAEAKCFGELLGAYLVGLALGAFFSRRFCSTAPGGGARSPLRVLGGFLVVSNVLGFLAVPVVAWMATRVDPDLKDYRSTLWVFGAVAATLGTNLPLITHFAVPADEKAGVGMARIYVANIVGSTAGSLLTGLLFLDHLRLWQISTGLAAFGTLVGALLLGGVGSGARSLRPIGFAVLVALALALASPRLHDGLFEKLRMKADYPPGYHEDFLIENKSGVIAVDQSHGVYGGGAYDGQLNVDPADNRNHINRAYATAVLHPNPKHILMIGLGSGSWAQVLAHEPRLESLTVIDINAGYLDLMAHYDVVRSTLANPKVTFVIDDARRWMSRHPTARFDVIVQNTTHYWRAHATNLVSKEYFELAARHLTDGGVFWSNSTHSAEIQKTYLAVFPHVRKMHSFVAGSAKPMSFDREKSKAVLLDWTIDGRKMFDPSNPGAVDAIAAILGEKTEWRGGDGKPVAPDQIEYTEKWYERAELEALVAEKGRRERREIRVITDDNMACEFLRR